MLNQHVYDSVFNLFLFYSPKIIFIMFNTRKFYRITSNTIYFDTRLLYLLISFFIYQRSTIFNLLSFILFQASWILTVNKYLRDFVQSYVRFKVYFALSTQFWHKLYSHPDLLKKNCFFKVFNDLIIFRIFKFRSRSSKIFNENIRV